MSRAYSVILSAGNISGTPSSPSTTSASVQNYAVRGTVTGLHGLTSTLRDTGTDSVTVFGVIFGLLAALLLVLFTYAVVGIWFWREWNRDE
jgi:hypothetical protein